MNETKDINRLQTQHETTKCIIPRFDKDRWCKWVADDEAESKKIRKRTRSPYRLADRAADDNKSDFGRSSSGGAIRSGITRIVHTHTAPLEWREKKQESIWFRVERKK